MSMETRVRFDFYLKNIDAVEGWLTPTTAFISYFLMIHQTELGIRGNACEIGVHHGKYLIALACALAAEESALAVDLFEDQDQNIDGSGCGDRSILTRNFGHFLPPDSLVVKKANSLDLGPADITTYGMPRFFSVDGGHTEAVTCHDLRLAEQSVCPGGIVALDDILNYHWTGVLSGYARYKYNGGGLKAFALVPNKLLLSDAAFAPRYGTFMRDRFPLFAEKFGKEMLSDLIDVYGDRPDLLEMPLQKIDRLQRDLAAANEKASRMDADNAELRGQLALILHSKRYRLASKFAGLYRRVLGGG